MASDGSVWVPAKDALIRFRVVTNQLVQSTRQFSSVGKKDFVSAEMYCYAAFLMWLRSDDWRSRVAPQDASGFALNAWFCVLAATLRWAANPVRKHSTFRSLAKEGGIFCKAAM